MKKAPAFFAFAVLLNLVAPPAFGREPKLNIEAICMSREADAKMLRSTPAQNRQDCVHDEEAAKQQLNNIWALTSAFVRNRCESDARSLGTMSYLDLLTCVQMEQEMKSSSKKRKGVFH
jgi:hypothetical protein